MRNAKQSQNQLMGLFNVWPSKSGCQWRMLPKDFPKWKTVNDYFARWCQDGRWQGLNDALREPVRTTAGRDKMPSAGSIDSQSVKTAPKGGNAAMTAARKSRGQTAWDCRHHGLGAEGVCHGSQFPES